jgi:hypothetical protein
VEWVHMDAQSLWDIASVSWAKKDKQRTTAISAALHTYPHPTRSHMCTSTIDLGVNSIHFLSATLKIVLSHLKCQIGGTWTFGSIPLIPWCQTTSVKHSYSIWK